MSVSILIPVYNKEEAIGKVLTSLLPQIDNKDEVIVLDDGSTDNSGAIIDGFPVKKIYRPRKNNLFRNASGRNMLVRESHHDRMIFLSGDCVPRADFRETYRIAANSDREVIIRGMVHPGQPLDHGYHKEWDRLITGNMSISKRTFNFIGGLDENFDGCWGHEDMEFAYRAIKIYGFKLFCIPAWVDHVWHRRKEQRGKRNLAYFKRKHKLK